MNDGDVKHSYSAISFNFLGPFDIGVDGFEVVVQGLDVVVVDGKKGIVGFSQPKQDDISRADGVVPSGIVGEGFLLEIFREWFTIQPLLSSPSPLQLSLLTLPPPLLPLPMHLIPSFPLSLIIA